MRLTHLLLLIAIVGLLPTAASRPEIDDTVLVTAARPVALALLVPQDGRVTLFLDPEQGAYDGLSAHVDDVCSGGQDMGAAVDAPPTDPEPPVELDDENTVTVHCGHLEAGWYVLEISMEAGAARLQLGAAGATLH